MGRKNNKKKKARAARPAAAQSTPGTTTTTTIHSLKGIISTNDHPFQCHGCSKELVSAMCVALGAADGECTSVCCGKMFCHTCCKAGKCPSVVGVTCSSCGGVLTTLKLLRARAKKGHPWAQFALAWQLRDESIPEARKWCLEAAKGGHPFAFALLSQFCLHAHGRRHFNRDAATSIDFAVKGMEILLSSELMLSESAPFLIAHIYLNMAMAGTAMDNTKGLRALLEPFASKGLRGVQCLLSMTCHSMKDFSPALDLARKAVVQAGAHGLSPGLPVALAADCCKKLDRTVEGLFWEKQAAIADGCRNKEQVEAIHSELCRMRKSCGTCGTSLDSSSRKLCKGCKICCYCSRECQKVHWSRPDDGHRDQCKTIMELVEEIKEEKKKE